MSARPLFSSSSHTPPHTWLDAHQRWGVWGLGASGVASANLLARHGKAVTVSDPRGADVLGPMLALLRPEVRVVFGENSLAGVDAIVTSPGLPPHLPVFAQARQRGIPVISEIELAYDCATAPFLCITGTDGKTTTTSLLGAIFAQAGREHVVAGNIGTPLCEVVESVSPQGVIIAEVSAFQLWTIHHFRPRVACLTNLAADHLDYFSNDFEAYADAKRKLAANMKQGDWLWLNAHDARSEQWASGFSGELGLFALSSDAFEARSFRAPNLAWREESRLCYALHEGETQTLVEDLTTLGLSGRHNQLNMLCASAMALGVGVAPEIVAEALRTFRGLPHRFETIATVQGVRYIDDSKATNAHAALAGLRGHEGEEPLVVIAGGVDKGLDLAEFAEFLAGRASAVLLIGQLRDRLEEALRAAGLTQSAISRHETLEGAVVAAHELARACGGSVVLSPAASSFDMFQSYAQRGEVFQQAVRALEG